MKDSLLDLKERLNMMRLDRIKDKGEQEADNIRS